MHTSKIFVLIFIATFSVFLSCKDEPVEYESNDCKMQPPFIKSLGFNPNNAALSTSANKKMGLVLIELNNAGDTGMKGKKLYQHPSWSSAGSLGPIQLIADGSCFLAPVPMINLINNPVNKQNIIYKVDAINGEMKTFAELPALDSITPFNPYGILGLAYLCESNILYTSSVYGSTRVKENGCIYAIDAATGNIIDKINNIDAIGIGISYMGDKRKLYYGSARSSSIYSIELNEKGAFKGTATFEFDIANLGPRGDDKVRRIRFDKKTGSMIIYGVEFNFNLTAPTEKQESLYYFSYNVDINKWVHNKTN